jgi:acyl-homoserine lactone acylase PvdQ
MGFKAPASNALLVSAKESATGNPLEIGAPQVGYAVPSFFYDIDLHVSGDDPVDFRGPAVPGASALIPLGRGRDYAWSLTTGYSDAVDTRAEKLCAPKGGEATVDSTGYVFKGECKEMESRTEEFTLHPTPTDPGEPGTEQRTFYRTMHGPVFARGKVNGAPTAFVKERFFWMREVDSIPSFYAWNTKVHSIDDFKAAAKTFTMSFNSFYADAQDIGYFHVGLYPKRTPGTSPSLPTWGTGQWEWKGRLPFDLQPQIVNPKQGWLANWNNKPALGWSNYDSIKWGSIQRMQLLADGMKAATAGPKKLELSGLVDVIRDAATRDTRGVYLGPQMVKWASADAPENNKKVAQALDIVQAWIDKGSDRKNADGDANMDDGPALAIFDKWYDELVHRIFDDELGPEGYDLIAAPVTDYTPEGGSSFWFDFSSYLRNMFNPKSKVTFALDYCDNRESSAKETCRKLVLSSLIDALSKLAKDQKEPDMTKWTKPAENIVFQELGAGSVDPIPWQNRGTHNHVVEILEDAG